MPRQPVEEAAVPVLSLDGRVVAINSAILPEFGGSNLGVPAARARELLSGVRPLP